MNNLTIARILFPPDQDDGLADLDWVTGCVRWHISFGEYTRIFETQVQAMIDNPRSVSDKDKFVLFAALHEHIHLRQIFLTSFAYDFSARMLDMAYQTFRKYNGNMDRIMEGDNEYVEPIANLFSSLTREGEMQVTTQALLESSAYFAQYSPMRNFSVTWFDEILAEEVEDSPYRAAYDLAVQICGPDALGWFIHVVNLALLTTRPEIVFVPLLKEFSHGASKLNTHENHELGMRFMNKNFQSILLGLVPDYQSKNRYRHFLLDRGIRDFYSSLGSSTSKLESIFRDYHPPQDILSASNAIQIFPPTLQGGPMVIPPDCLSDHDFVEYADGNRVSLVRCLFAVGTLLRQQVLDTRPPALRPPKRNSMTGRVDGRPEPWVWIYPDDSTRLAGSSIKLVRMLREVSSDRSVAISKRGTLFLAESPSAGKSRLNLENSHWLLDPNFQSFLRQTFWGIPQFAYFLANEPKIPGASVIAIILSAFAPDSIRGFSNGELVIAISKDSLGPLYIYLNAAAVFSENLGGARSQVLQCLSSLPEGYASELRSRIL